MEEKNNNVEKYLELSQEIAKKVEEMRGLVKPFENANDYNGDIEQEIDKNIKEVSDLKDEAKKLILKVIAYMYDGVLITGELTSRRGKLYRYRCSYEIGFARVVDLINKHRGEVTEKLKEKNVKLINELLLGYKNIESYKDYYRHYNKYELLDDEELKFGREVIDIDEEIVLVFDDDEHRGRTDLDLIKINKIIVSDEGIKFCYLSSKSDEDNEQEDYYTSVRLNEITGAIITEKLKEKIKDSANRLNFKINEKKKVYQDKIKEIKEKGGRYLILAGLDDDENDR